MIKFSYSQLVFICLIILLTSFMLSLFPIPIGYVIAVAIFYGARNWGLVENFKKSDLLWIPLMVAGFLFYTISLIYWAFSQVSWLTIVIVALLCEGILFLSGHVPVIGDVAGGIIAGALTMIVMMVFIGGTAGMVVGGVFALLVLAVALVPYHIPGLVLASFIIIKLLTNFIYSIVSMIV